MVCRIGKREVGERRADQEVRAPVQKVFCGERSIVADFGDAHFHRAAVEAAAAVGELCDVGHQLRARDVDEADDVAEVHRHADADRVSARSLFAVAEIGAEDVVDVDAGHRDGRCGCFRRRRRFGCGGRLGGSRLALCGVVVTAACGTEQRNYSQQSQDASLHDGPSPWIEPMLALRREWLV